MNLMLSKDHSSHHNHITLDIVRSHKNKIQSNIFFSSFYSSFLWQIMSESELNIWFA